MIIVGVNGGGTKTEALCCNESGIIIGRGKAGPSNYHNVGLGVAVQHINEAISKATKEKPDIVCVGLAAMDTKKDFDTIYQKLIQYYKWVIVEHDAFAELYGEEKGMPGIMAIAGTGSVVLGYDGKNRYRRCNSGWFLGDEGSGYFIGRQGLKAASRMIFEEAERTPMADSVVAALGLKDPEELMEWSYSDRNTVTAVASAAKAVFAAADGGDKAAKTIIKTASANLANAACELALRLKIKTVHIKGGLIHSKLYYSNFSRILKKKGIETKPMHESEAEGALMIAADSVGVKLRIR